MKIILIGRCYRVLANATAFYLYRQVLEDIGKVPFFLEV